MTELDLAPIRALWADTAVINPKVSYEGEHYIGIFTSDDTPEVVWEFYYNAIANVGNLIAEVERLRAIAMSLSAGDLLKLPVEKRGPFLALHAEGLADWYAEEANRD